jgi:phage terminase small subunit
VCGIAWARRALRVLASGLGFRPEAEEREESVILRRDERVMGWCRDRCVKAMGRGRPAKRGRG